MLRGELAKNAFSLTWRFMICFVVLSYPVFSQMMVMMKSMSESPESISNANVMFFLVMNILIPIVIPYFAMYGALFWILTGRKDVQA